jgi:biopolymer transport protein ExbD
MKRKRMPEIKEGGVNVTPLIDIVMCLIIFFMLVARIGVDTGGDKSIPIPASILGTDIKDLGNCLNLNVRPGPMTADGPEPLVSALLHDKSTELHVLGNKNTLLETLQFYRNGDPGSGIPPNPEFKVIIRGDTDMTYDFLQPVLMACAQAQVRNVSFVTKKVESEQPQ